MLDGASDATKSCDVSLTMDPGADRLQEALTDIQLAAEEVLLTRQEKGDLEGQDVDASTVHIHGTLGYILPEYAVEGRLSTRGDVYSYGVVLLEMLTGKPPTEELHTPQNTPEEASAGSSSVLETSGSSHKVGSYRARIPKLYQENSLQMLDAKLMEESTLDSTKQEQMRLMLLVALLCTRDMPQSRPTMSDVSAILTQIREIRSNVDVVRKTIDELVKEAPPKQDAHV